MYSWLSTQIGADAAQVVSYVIGLSALALFAWLSVAFLRRRNKALFVVLGKNRPMRLSVRDATAVDAQRRIVLVRRDDTEHLILIGGPSDVVIECNITPPDIEKRAPETQKTGKTALSALAASLSKKTVEEKPAPALIQSGAGEQTSVPDKKVAVAEQPEIIAAHDSAASEQQDTAILEDQTEAMLLAIEQAVQDDFLLEDEEESHILPPAAIESILQAEPQTAAPKANTVHTFPSPRQPVSTRAHEPQPQQQKTRAPLSVTVAPKQATVSSTSAKSSYRQPQPSQTQAFRPAAAASQTSQRTPPATRKTTPVNLLPEQKAQTRPATTSPLFAKQQSKTADKRPLEKKGQTDFKPFLPTDNEDFEKLIQEELLRTQINLKTPLPNKN